MNKAMLFIIGGLFLIMAAIFISQAIEHYKELRKQRRPKQP
jgi:hypothetical protein